MTITFGIDHFLLLTKRITVHYIRVSITDCPSAPKKKDETIKETLAKIKKFHKLKVHLCSRTKCHRQNFALKIRLSSEGQKGSDATDHNASSSNGQQRKKHTMPITSILSITMKKNTYVSLLVPPTTLSFTSVDGNLSFHLPQMKSKSQKPK